MPAPLLIRLEMTFQKIRHEEEPDDHKENKKFDQDYDPEVPAPFGHVPETIDIEPEDAVQDRSFLTVWHTGHKILGS
jgi:hypothetical protein